MITKFIFWYLSKKYKSEMKKKDIDITIYEIKGTGKDYPKYLLYTESERVRQKALNI